MWYLIKRLVECTNWERTLLPVCVKDTITKRKQMVVKILEEEYEFLTRMWSKQYSEYLKTRYIFD